MNYKTKLYSEYVSNNISSLYGEMNLNHIKKQFPVWNKYYGRHLSSNKGIKILEIGCGNGGFLYYLNALGYRDYYGIDISEEQVKLAKQLGIENVERSDLREFLKNKENHFDVILCRDVLEHFNKEEIIEVIKLIYISLRKKGQYILQVPNAESPFSGRYRYGDFTHEISFTRVSLNQILRSTGFENISCHSTGPVPHYLKSIVRFMLWIAIESLLRIYMLVETGSGDGIFTQTMIVVAKK